MSAGLASIEEIKRMLGARAEEICHLALSGGTLERGGRRYAAGSLAGEAGQSLSICLRVPGMQAGVWRDFATGEAGDILDLVRLTVVGDRTIAGALKWSRGFLGLAAMDGAALRRQDDEARAAAAGKAAASAAATDKTQRFAFALWLRALALDATPAAAYLAGRGIDLARCPSTGALRFDPNCLDTASGRRFPAMLAAMSGPHGLNGAGEKKGGFCALHRTFLQRRGAAWTKAAIDRPKKMLGPAAGAHVSLGKGAAGTPLTRAKPGEALIIAEGIEDALTLAMLYPERRIAAAGSLGLMARMAVPPAVTRRYVVADRPADLRQRAALERVVAAHQRQGAHVTVVRAPDRYKDINEWWQAERAQRAAAGARG